jgi:hypothetical protein
VHRRAGSIPGLQTPCNSDLGADPVYLPDIGYFDSEAGIYFDPELGYRDVVVPETVPGEWVTAYGADGDGGCT